VSTLRPLQSGPLAEQFAWLFEEISKDVQIPSAAGYDPKNPQVHAEKTAAAVPAATILVQTPPALWLGLTGYLPYAFEVLATLALTIVLLIFFLLRRDELRDRIVMLAGNARLTVNSKALEDVTERMSRYIMTVAMLIGDFGTLVALGRYGLQVPCAILWGLMTGIFRFSPYVESWIGAMCPIAMWPATSDGWLQPMIVVVLPAPFEPRSPNTSRSLTLSEIASTAISLPKRRESALISMIGSLTSCSLSRGLITKDTRFQLFPAIVPKLLALHTRQVKPAGCELSQALRSTLSENSMERSSMQVERRVE